MKNYMKSFANARLAGAMLAILFIGLFRQAHAQEYTITHADSLALESQRVTLDQTIHIAIANNIDIKRALLNLEDADQQVRIAWSEVMPDITGDASYTRNIELPVFFFPVNPGDPDSELRAIQAGEDNNWNGAVSVNQTLFRGEAIVGISTSQLFKAAQAENLRATSQQVVTQTRLAYYNVLVSEQQLRLQEATVERLRENLAENQARKEAGLVDDYAVLQVEVQLGNQEPQLTRARYDVAQAYRELKLVMGIPLEMDLDVVGDLGKYSITSHTAESEVNRHIKKVNQMTPYEFQADRDVLDIATDMRGDIRILEKRNDLKDREILAIKSRFLPTLSTSYSLGWRAEEPGALNFFGNDQQRVRTQSLRLNLSVPIFQGFERNANLQIAKIEKKDLEEQKRQALRSAKNDIQSAREDLNQAIETAPARRKALEQAREGYQRALARFNNGIGSQLDVTNAEFQLRQAEVNYAQMVYNYLAAKARYDQAVGMVPFVDNETPDIE